MLPAALIESRSRELGDLMEFVMKEQKRTLCAGPIGMVRVGCMMRCVCGYEFGVNTGPDRKRIPTHTLAGELVPLAGEIQSSEWTCPGCAGRGFTSEYVGFIGVPDENKVTCACGWEGWAWELDLAAKKRMEAAGGS